MVDLGGAPYVDHESDPAYQAFTTYRDLGYDRSVTKVARKLHKSRTIIGRWSVRWSWRYRVEEWDRDKETLKAAALNTSIQAMAERQASQAARYRVEEWDRKTLRHIGFNDRITTFDTASCALTPDPVTVGVRRGTRPAMTAAVAVHAPSTALPILNPGISPEHFMFREFAHPDGVRVDPDTKYWIVISQTTPEEDGVIAIDGWSEFTGALEERLAAPPVDPGSEDGWSVDYPDEAVSSTRIREPTEIERPTRRRFWPLIGCGVSVEVDFDLAARRWRG